MTVNESAGEDLNAWIRKLNQDIAVLRQAIMLQTSPSERAAREEMRPYFEATAKLVDEVERQTEQIHAYVSTGHTQHRRMAALSKRSEDQAQRVARIRAHLPADMAAALEALLIRGPHDQNAPAAATEERPAPAVEGASVLKSRQRAPRPAAAAKATRGRPTEQRRESPIVREDTVPAVSGEFPQVARVTAEELAAAPQYVKGRLTLEKIDKVVDKLNEFLVVKYTLVKKKHRELRSSDIDKWQAFQDNECAETKGEKFVTDGELKDFGDFKMDPTARSVINVLRHIGALKEVRGKNKTRIFIVKEVE